MPLGLWLPPVNLVHRGLVHRLDYGLINVDMGRAAGDPGEDVGNAFGGEGRVAS